LSWFNLKRWLVSLDRSITGATSERTKTHLFIFLCTSIEVDLGSTQTQSSWQSFAPMFSVFGYFLVLIHIILCNKARNIKRSLQRCDITLPDVRYILGHLVYVKFSCYLDCRAVQIKQIAFLQYFIYGGQYKSLSKTVTDLTKRAVAADQYA